MLEQVLGDWEEGGGGSLFAPRSVSLFPIPVIGSITRGTQWLNCSMHSSMEPCIEQFSLWVSRAMEPIPGIGKRLLSCRANAVSQAQHVCPAARTAQRDGECTVTVTMTVSVSAL